MNDTKHTPGPWWFAQHDEYGRYDIGQGDAVIARTCAPADSGPGEAAITDYMHEHQRSNARLIAAAPDLLTALRAIDHAWTSDMPSGPQNPIMVKKWRQLWEQARAALAKVQP